MGGAWILGVRLERTPRHVVGIRTETPENLLPAGKESFRTLPTVLPKCLGLPILGFKRGRKFIRLLLHQCVDGGLSVRGQLGRGGKTLDLL